MTAPAPSHPDYRHGLLVHDNDDELIQATCTFVGRGLAAGDQVLVHGTRDRVRLMREVLGTPPGLTYGFDEELYLEPTRTLFAYQRTLAEAPPGSKFWVTGTVPLGNDASTQAAWNRYESSVNAALADYPFRALCTYDTRTRPGPVIAAARATHPVVGPDLRVGSSPEYVEPASFLDDPLAQVPAPPEAPPTVATMAADLRDLRAARHVLAARARSDSAVPHPTVEKFLLAVHEVAANGLDHGCPPVRITLWATVGRLTCLVEDSGRGHFDPMTGFRSPVPPQVAGLWLARQLVDDLFIGDSPAGGGSVLLTAT